MAQIPGQFVNSVGGALVIGPFGGAWGNAGQNVRTMISAGTNPGPVCFPPYAAANVTWLDCQNWQLRRRPIFDDVTGTYSYGGVNRDQTAEDWDADAMVVVDQRFPVDMLLKYGVAWGKGNPITSQGASQFGFNLGVELILVVGCGTNYPENSALDFYYCPSAKLAQNGPIIDAGNKKDVRFPVGIAGNTRIFKMPAECNVLSDFIVNNLQVRGLVF